MDLSIITILPVVTKDLPISPRSGGGHVKTFRWDHRLQIRNLFIMAFKVAVNTVRILSKSCMFFCVLRFAKNTNFLLKGGIHCFSMSIFRLQFRFSQVPRLVEFWTEYIWYKLQPKATQSTNNTTNVSVNLHGISDTSTHGATP